MDIMEVMGIIEIIETVELTEIMEIMEIDRHGGDERVDRDDFDFVGGFFCFRMLYQTGSLFLKFCFLRKGGALSEVKFADGDGGTGPARGRRGRRGVGTGLARGWQQLARGTGIDVTCTTSNMY